MIRKYLKLIDRYIVVIALLSITCGVIGQYMMSWDYLWAPNIDDQYISEYADPEGKILSPLEPLAKGLKVVGGIDSYAYHENDFHSIWQHVGYHIFEVARWLGYIVYFRTIVWLLHASFTTLDSERKAKDAIRRGEDVIAIHGDSVYAATLAKNLIDAGRTISVTDAKILPALGDKAPATPTSLSVALEAPLQVVMFDSDRDTLEFLDEQAPMMPADAHVFVRLDDIVPSGLFDEHVTPFSMAIICASLYWSRYPIFLTKTDGEDRAPDDAAEVASYLTRPLTDGPRYRLVIIGDIDFTEQLLEWGLLSNISDVTGGIRYDVIGDMDPWRQTHPGLDAAVATNADEVHFHTGAWYDHRDLLHAADRVVLCGRTSDNVRIASELLSEPIRKLHVRANTRGSLLVLGEPTKDSAGPTEIEVFGTIDEVCTPALVLQDDKTTTSAKMREVLYGLGTARCNGCETFDFAGIAEAPEDAAADDELCQKIRAERAACIQATGTDGLDRCLTCPRFEAAWRRRDGLSRRNNFADAYHLCQKYRLMHLMGLPLGADVTIAVESEQFAQLPNEAKEALREIEHIRWRRFYFLNGWSYAPGPRNARARTHPELVPYAELGDDVKRLRFDNGYINVCQVISSTRMQGRMDAVWLGDEDDQNTPGAQLSAQSQGTSEA